MSTHYACAQEKVLTQFYNRKQCTRTSIDAKRLHKEKTGHEKRTVWKQLHRQEVIEQKSI